MHTHTHFAEGHIDSAERTNKWERVVARIKSQWGACDGYGCAPKGQEDERARGAHGGYISLLPENLYFSLS